jgi:hypothetical protein
MTDPIENSLPQTEMLSLSKLQGESLRQGEVADLEGNPYERRATIGSVVILQTKTVLA